MTGGRVLGLLLPLLPLLPLLLSVSDVHAARYAKCCPDGQEYGGGGDGGIVCRPSAAPASAGKLPAHDGDKALGTELYAIITVPTWCEDGTRYLAGSEGRFFVQSNGSVFVPSEEATFAVDEYCIEFFAGQTLHDVVLCDSSGPERSKTYATDVPTDGGRGSSTAPGGERAAPPSGEAVEGVRVSRRFKFRSGDAMNTGAACAACVAGVAAMLSLALLADCRRARCKNDIAVNVSAGLLRGDVVAWQGFEYPAGAWHVAPDGALVVCACDARPCYRKCCAPHETFHETEGCQPSDQVAHLRLAFDAPVYRDTERVNVSDRHFAVVPSGKCEHSISMANEPFYLQTDGTLLETLYLDDGDTTMERHEPQNFCLEAFNGTLYAFVCFSPAEQENVAYSIGMLISMPFLLVTFLVYAGIPELRNLHGKCLMCYVAALLVAYGFLVTVQLSRETIAMDPGFCVTAAFVIYFSFMTSFLWLNVMCADIWWTFSGRRGFGGSARDSERRRFLAYSAYAWGVPAAMVAVTAALQFVPADAVADGVLRPRFGEGRCWFPDDRTVGCYFYWPVLFIIVLNVVLFASTTWRIYRVKRDTDRSMRHDSRRHGDDDDVQRYRLYLKLMLVFGVNWSMEIVSWLIAGPDWLWYVSDLCNALYGLFIFAVFLCKPNVWRLARKRYHTIMGRPYAAKAYASSSSTRVTGASGDITASTSMAMS